MKVLDLQLYRAKRERQRLENRVIAIALETKGTGTAREIKSCFKAWLKFR